MFDVMPELNSKRYRPPLPRLTLKTFAKNPKTHQHDHGIAVVQCFGFNKPREPLPENSTGFRERPAKQINLDGLRQMFGPVREDDDHKNLQGPFVPSGVEFFV